MRAHIVLAHPESGSFNGQLASITSETLTASGFSVTMSDLYAMGFDPRESPDHFGQRKDNSAFHAQTEQRFNAENDSLPPDVQAEIDHLLGSDLLVVHFPLWWFGMPAMLKGWMDRVFVYGRMYKSQERYDRGVCVGKRVLVCVTTGASANACSFNGREGDTQLLLWPVLFPFRYLGFDVYVPEVLHGVGGVDFVEGHDSGLSRIDQYFERWRSALAELDQRPLVRYNPDSDFDETTRLLPDAEVYSPFIGHDPDRSVW